MTIESFATYDESTLPEKVIDQASDLLLTALEGSLDAEDALERANENLEPAGYELVKKVEEDERPRDWHDREHGWAIVYERLVADGIFRARSKTSQRMGLFNSLIDHDEKLSRRLNDQRSPEEKTSRYYADRMRMIAQSRSAQRRII